MAIRTTGIDHIHVFARDLNGLLALFGRLFECEYTQQSEIESLQAFNSTMRFTGATSVPYLDLFEPSGETGQAARSFERMGEGVAVLSFGVEDLDEAAKHAESCGLRIVSRFGFPVCCPKCSSIQATPSASNSNWSTTSPTLRHASPRFNERKRQASQWTGFARVRDKTSDPARATNQSVTARGNEDIAKNTRERIE